MKHQAEKQTLGYRATAAEHEEVLHYLVEINKMAGDNAKHLTTSDLLRLAVKAYVNPPKHVKVELVPYFSHSDVTRAESWVREVHKLLTSVLSNAVCPRNHCGDCGALCVLKTDVKKKLLLVETLLGAIRRMAGKVAVKKGSEARELGVIGPSATRGRP